MKGFSQNIHKNKMLYKLCLCVWIILWKKSRISLLNIELYLFQYNLNADDEIP